MRRREFLGASALAPVLQVGPGGGSADPLVVDATVPAETSITITVAQHETVAREEEVYAEAVKVRDGERGYHVPLAPGYVTSLGVSLETDEVTRTPQLHRVTVSVPGSGEGADPAWGVYGGIIAVVGGALLRSRVSDENPGDDAVRESDELKAG